MARLVSIPVPGRARSTPPTPPTPESGSVPFSFNFQPANRWQHTACDQFYNPNTRILFLLGPAGTGKSHLAVALSIKAYLSSNIEHIYLTRPLVPACGEDLGFLPGDVTEKFDPYLLPFHQVLGRCTYGKLPKGLLEPLPLALMRGCTFLHSMALLDEAQNCTYSQLKLFISRIGTGSKLIITGDPTQSDLRTKHRDDPTDLDTFVDHLSQHPAVSIVRFPDTPEACVRDPLVASLLSCLD